MDKFDEYYQVLCAGMPPIEALAGPKESPELARICNDGMAELCAQHPQRFPTFIASLALNNPDSCIEEIHRCVKDLGARGVQVFSNVDGKPLDLPEFAPIFDTMAQYDLPILLHRRAARTSPTTSPRRSRSTRCGGRTAGLRDQCRHGAHRFAGIFDKHPDIKIVSHHYAR